MPISHEAETQEIAWRNIALQKMPVFSFQQLKMLAI
jgi:hypothetical protein